MNNQKIIKMIVFVLIIFGSSAYMFSETIEYDLTIDYQWVKFTDKKVKAMTINGGIPGPILFMNEGDTVKIRVHNKMKVETSIHWHGILLPNREDGVPYLTTPPIMPGKTHVFQFPVIQSGTYWYHSHTGFQEQRGVYGSIVIHPKEKRIHVDRDYVLVLSDWTDEDPKSVLRTLKRGSEYYSLKKGSTQSLFGAIRAKALSDTFNRWLNRMPPMDVSDVAYDKFLINGKPVNTLSGFPGEKIRLRIINAAASTYFYLQFAQESMRIISADGLDVDPVDTERFLIAIAETYDVIITMPQNGKAFELRATAQDGSGKASVFLGAGKKIFAPDIPKPNLYKMHSGMDHGVDGTDHKAGGKKSAMDRNKTNQTHGNHRMKQTKKESSHQDSNHKMMKHRMKTPSVNKIMFMERPLAPYQHLKSLKPTKLNSNKKLRKITLNVTGDMERYVWSFNGKTLKEADLIRIENGENVQIEFINKTMMHHPIHLHGHFFRVLNKQGDHSPLKHTVDIPPMGKQTIEFFANEDKDWFLHCHILYHMDAGMARIVHYEGSKIDPDIAKVRQWPNNPLQADHWFFWSDVSALSQMTEGRIVAANTRNTFLLNWEGGWKEKEYEVDALYSRYFNRFFNLFTGVHYDGNEARGIIGFSYLLPFLIESLAWIDHKGNFRIALEREFQLTSRLGIFGEVEYDKEQLWEWSAGAKWTVSRRFSLLGQFHSEYGYGIGILFEY